MEQHQKEHKAKIELQREQLGAVLQQRDAELKQRDQQHKDELDALLSLAAKKSTEGMSTPSFAPFDSTTELWQDYWSRFCTFVAANSIPDERKAQVFLTSQSPALYKQLSNLAAQKTPKKDINSLTMKEITEFMEDQYDPKRFIVRERFKFWSDMQRKPGETLQELASRIRHDAATCHFSSIQDPQDEALRQRFICSVNNEAVLKALFKIKEDELTFAKAVQVAIETEDAAKVAKETVYGAKGKSVHKIKKGSPTSSSKANRDSSKVNSDSSKKIKCYRCGKDHKAPDCPHKNSKCTFCSKVGHLEIVCRKKQYHDKKTVNTKIIRQVDVKTVPESTINAISSKLEVPVTIQGKKFTMELDTGTTGNFVSVPVWEQLGKPQLTDAVCHYKSATNHNLPVMGIFTCIYCSSRQTTPK